MMKGIILAALLAATTAHAGTITLPAQTCSGTSTAQTCSNPAPGIEYLSQSEHYGRLLVTMNGEMYDSGLWAVYPASVNGEMVTSSAVLTAADGTTLTASITWKVVTASKCIQEGRTCIFPTTVTLIGGTITQ
jgi:hypothetical protein